MPTAILNVPLHRITEISALDQRHRMVMTCMRLCFQEVVGEMRPQADAAWSVVTVGFTATRSVFEDAVGLLARQIGCGYIHLLSEDGSGSCVGPEPVDFDPSWVLLPSICELAVARAA